MKGTSTALGLATSFLAVTTGATDSVIQWDFAKQQGGQGRSVGRRGIGRHGIGRRASSVDASVSNKQTEGGYFASVSIGTPGQQLSLQLDTGSSDVWVPYSEAQACQSGLLQGEDGCELGSFDPRKSSSFEDTGEGKFVIQYVDESGAKGDYFEDNFQIGGVTIKNLTMGLALQTSISYGLVGVGYAVNEAAQATDYDLYPNLPVAMKDSGFIQTIAYSLWLNDLDASKGSILFGGIDTERYNGQLKVLDILPDAESGKIVHFTVPMTGLRGVSSSGTDSVISKELPIPAILDSGTTLTYLPQDMAETVWSEVGAVYDNVQSKSAVVPCSYANHEGYFSFEFGGSEGVVVNVTMDELVVGFSGSYLGGQPACVFGIQNQTNPDTDPDAPYLIGDSFLRSAYVVYDLVNNQIGMAPTEFNATKSNVVPFPSMGATIPSSSPVPNQNTTANQPGEQGGLTASKGFQDENAASSVAHLSVVGLALTSLAAVLALL